MIHITLNTGHTRISPRSEVSDDIVDTLRPLVRAGGGPLPGPARGYRVQIMRDGRDAAFTILGPLVSASEPGPIVTCGLALDDATVVWRGLQRLMPDAPCQMPTTMPWLGVVILPTAALAADATDWLGDAERCIAWTMIEEYRVS